MRLSVGLVLSVCALSACGARTELRSARGSSGSGAAGGAGGAGGARPVCIPTGEEVCNDLDDDCDGEIDEGLTFGARGPATPVRTNERASFVAGNRLAATPEGLVAFWINDFHGDDPTPNAFARQLDAHGAATSEALQLFDWPVPNGLRVAPTSGDRLALSFCYQIQAKRSPASAFVGFDGHSLGEPVLRAPEMDWCGGEIPLIAWTGERHLLSWTGLDGPLVEIAGANGEHLSSEPLHSEGPTVDFLSGFSAAHDRALSVVVLRPEPAVTNLSLTVLDAKGTILHEVIVEPPGRFANPLVAPSGDGWLVLGRRDEDTGAWLLRVDANGTVVSGPVLSHLDRIYADNGEWDLVARPGKGFYFTGLYRHDFSTYWPFLSVLDENGEIALEIAGPAVAADAPIGWITHPSLAVKGGSVLRLHNDVALDADGNQLFIQEFGCVEGAPD
jgi:hypothetical protein